ncbi:IclR family transcriptional regulator [Halobaculum marinum]|uniref:IclR family transcriptional regulator n=1 Tax=Halobaculum marinum TaxID=3031996 RepID=A0ABD5WTF3_9EURY|nr:IclR family transcriptional regulator [Halobaculum sp. DT55]
MGEYPVGASHTTARVVDALLEVDDAGVSELARELGLSKGTVHNHLQTLERLGVVRASDGRYRLGLALLDAGMTVRDRRSLYRSAREFVTELAETTGESAVLAVAEGDDAVYVDVRRPERNHYRFRAGSRVPLHTTAPGKVLLAHRSADEIDRYATAVDATPTDRTFDGSRALRKELRSVEDRGLAFDRGEFSSDMRGVAAPITAGGTAVGALGVQGPNERFSGKRLDEDLPGLVLSTAKQAGLALDQ